MNGSHEVIALTTQAHERIPHTRRTTHIHASVPWQVQIATFKWKWHQQQQQQQQINCLSSLKINWIKCLLGRSSAISGGFWQEGCQTDVFVTWHKKQGNIARVCVCWCGSSGKSCAEHRGARRAFEIGKVANIGVNIYNRIFACS